MNPGTNARKIRRASVVILILTAAFLTGAAPDDNAHTKDTQVVRTLMEETIDKAIGILEDPELKGEAHRDKRRAKLRSTLLAKADARRISLLTLGRQRSKFTESQIDEFSDVFSQLVFQSYITNLERYTDEKVRILSVDILPKSKSYVKTMIVTSDKEIPADFSLFKNEDGKWKVYDVKVEGVSLVSNYRTQFTELLLKQTPDELIQHLKEKVKENEKTD